MITNGITPETYYPKTGHKVALLEYSFNYRMRTRCCQNEQQRRTLYQPELVCPKNVDIRLLLACR